MARSVDKVEIIAADGSGFLDNFTSLQVTNDLTMPAEAAFELGDDATWPDMQEITKPGKEWRVYVNGDLRLTGRVEIHDVPTDAKGGSVTRFTIRTKVADAMFTSAEPSTRVKNVSIRDFMAALYAPLGYTKDDFVLTGDTARDLITGLKSGQKKLKKTLVGYKAVNGKVVNITTSQTIFATDIEKIKIDSAKVAMSEMIYDAADRHLRRHGLMHWDSPDGKIVIGAPDDKQDPLYHLQYNRLSNTRLNNVLSATRAKDYSGIPSAVVVYGFGALAGRTKDRIVGMVKDDDVYNSGFYRPVILSSEGMRNQAMAERAAQRELAARSKKKDCYVIEMDGLSYWDGNRNNSWGIDTVCSVTSDAAGLKSGPYFIHAVTLSRDATDGDKTNLTAMRRGIWTL